VGDCGILLSKLTAKKETPERIFYGLDTGFNHLLRPALYGSHHEIYNISRPDSPKEDVTVCGNICECSDNLGHGIQIGG
jgi:diaminopimelate decarboxylase